MLTTPRPARGPANTTVPAPGARIGSSTDPARSTPRCPGSHGWGGGAKRRVTVGGPATGQPHRMIVRPEGAVGGRSPGVTTGTPAHAEDIGVEASVVANRLRTSATASRNG